MAISRILGAYGTPHFGEGEVVGGQRWPHSKERWWSRLSIMTVPLAVSCNHSAALCDRMSPTLKSTGEWVTLGQNFGGVPLGVDPGCFGLQRANIPGELMMKEFQPTTIDQRHRRADRQTDDMRSLCTKVHRAVKKVEICKFVERLTGAKLIISMHVITIHQHYRWTDGRTLYGRTDRQTDIVATPRNRVYQRNQRIRILRRLLSINRSLTNLHTELLTSAYKMNSYFDELCY